LLAADKGFSSRFFNCLNLDQGVCLWTTPFYRSPPC